MNWRLAQLKTWLAQHWFALANSLFWVVVALENAITATVLQAQVHQLPVFVITRAIGGWLFCAWLHRSLRKRANWRSLTGWQRAVLVVGLLTAFAIGASLLIRGVRLAIGEDDPGMSALKFWVYVLAMELRLMVWAGFYLLISESRERLEIQARHAATELAMSRAQLNLLSAAFQPHFLMNAMNTLIACRHDPDAVEHAGEGLAGYLRYALDRSDTEWEPLATQMEALDNYLSVEELRFGDRLETRISSDPQLLHETVPRFLLQPLVENAIKHGLGNSSGSLQLHITIERFTRHLRMKVCNTGVLAGDLAYSPSGVGYGLSGIEQRLRWHYGNQASFGICQDGSWVVATLLLPLR